ncbi:MAG TPA: VWA domain-containing protein [Blastocatellia bacterium]|nr:VWA domain-containing protein [Blastocatellia bacterium]
MRLFRFVAVILAVISLVTFSTTLTSGQEGRSRTAAPQKSDQNKKNADQKSSVEQDEGPIQLNAELVDIVFTVLDERNRLVPNVKQDQLEVYEDGVQQEVRFFDKNTNVPIIAALLIDLSGSQEFVLPQEKDAAESFFQAAFRPGKDYGSIVTFRGETDLVQGLTSNTDRLTRSLRRLKRDLVFRGDEGAESQGTSLYEAIHITSSEVLADKTAKRITEGDDQFRYVIRKAMIVLTDGKDTTSQWTMKQAIEQANRYGILIYPIGIGDNFRFGEVDHKVLEDLARSTGGQAYFPKDETDLHNAFKQIQEELSSQYIVGYEPKNIAKDGTFRKVEIRLKGNQNWQVVHRSGYFAGDEKKH